MVDSSLTTFPPLSVSVCLTDTVRTFVADSAFVPTMRMSPMDYEVVTALLRGALAVLEAEAVS